MTNLRPMLMFAGAQLGKAEEAIEFYTALFPRSRIINIDRHGTGEVEVEGTVQLARFEIGAIEILATDSNYEHDFSFTPSISLFIDLESDAELDRVYGELVHLGKEMVPVDDYGFSRRYGWVQDRFGVSWQLNVP